MQIPATTNTAASTPTGTGTDGVIPLPTKMLSQNDFLQLLVTQMTSQDPLNPMTNQDMLTQMVQFSALQANTNLQSNLTEMQSSQAFLQASSLLGRVVGLQTGDTSFAQGIVTGVDVSSGVPQIVVNGAAYDLSQVLSVQPAAANP
jgi:flagellar basal-body rod modification protein FlgD